MHRKLLTGVILAFAWRTTDAQSVPARELWEFPLGAVLEPAALASDAGGGLWNPATLRLRAADRWSIGVASLASGAEQSVNGQVVTFAHRRSASFTIGLTVARSTVSGLIRTETDPTTVGTIPYSTLLVSLGASRQLLPHVQVGGALRYREGRADAVVRNAIAADVGVVVEHLPWRDGRVAASSFLWRPGRELEDRPAAVVAADVRVMGDTARETRAGVSLTHVNRGAREVGPFVSWRLARVDLRAAWLRTHIAARAVGRVRSGLALHANRYSVGLAREEGVNGLGPLYQFTLNTRLR